VGGMMRLGLHWIQEQIHSEVAAAGYEGLTLAHIRVFSFPRPNGRRPSEVAEKLQITKQSVNDLLGNLEDLGYLIRAPDPTDGRARVIRLTASGRKLQIVTERAAQSAELRVAELLGSRRFAQFRRGLEELTHQIDNLS
jgi:DNA-binding MarR family transcriptional regulator